ncbi:uncharacterized protein LOC121614467 isoform X2 [Chelmon rostratus]|uniref:uncharacterized protein LOC121614467 isoform X2 n=1 Tax=Chelmon rostratus TaxID=109905 RepID=UPI001BE5AC5E|nr:uncharacterized protein LOC121614467 isoform X2 [Chelmon rostratus]
MSRLQSVKVLIYQRLSAAVEEIIGHLETTITEYEEEMSCRHRMLLSDMATKPEDTLEISVFSADVKQPLMIKEEQQEWSPSLDQEDSKHPHIKEEKEDFWTCQEAASSTLHG